MRSGRIRRGEIVSSGYNKINTLTNSQMLKLYTQKYIQAQANRPSSTEAERFHEHMLVSEEIWLVDSL